MSPMSWLLPPGLPATSSMLYVGLVLVLMCGLSAEAGNGDLSKVEVDMTVEDYGEPKLLKCHNCYLSVDGMSCMMMDDFTIIGIQDCLADEPWCMVESLYTDHQLTTFTRKCSRDCRAGCQVAGDSYRLESCTSCCKEDYCNDDVAGAHLPTASPLLLLLLLSSLTLLQRAFWN